MMHETYKMWLDNNCPKIFCQCNCGQEIIVKKRHKYRGIPKCLLGHSSRLEEIKQKNRESHLGEKNHFYGKQHSEKNRQKIKNNKPDQSGEKHPMFGKHHTNESKQKNKKHQPDHSGKNNPAWKGGITSLNKRIRDSNKYFEWRLQIFGRDSFTCQSCGIRGTYLEAHHIKGFNEIIKEYNITKIEDALNCKILWDLNNGITYCLECHEKLKKKGGLL